MNQIKRTEDCESEEEEAAETAFEQSEAPTEAGPDHTGAGRRARRVRSPPLGFEA